MQSNCEDNNDKPIKVVLASSNRGKLKEFDELLSPLNYEVILQSALNVSEVQENGLSFVENALIKARHASAASGLCAIADDSGICVEALNGAPGIYSARFGGEHGNDKLNNEKLLDKLKDLPIQKRKAYYFCALVMLRHHDDPCPIIATGRWDGYIALKPQGNGGFGYDPLFFVPSRNCTAAQLTMQIKNMLSHRAIACRNLIHLLSRE